MAELTDRREERVVTPFGEPSAAYVTGTLRGQQVAFLARHGVGHRLLPSELNFRANIFGFKTLGVEYILSASAVGSLEGAIPSAGHADARSVLRSDEGPHLDVLWPRTRRARRVRASVLSDVSAMWRIRRRRQPVFPPRPSTLPESPVVHKGGTYVCMEGPQFSTLAESQLYRSWGMDVIGMTNLQEAKLAREAEICYTTIALITDYDCWHPSHDQVTVDMIVANLMQNAANAQRVIAEAVARLPFQRTCECASALKHAIITRPDAVPADVKRELAPTGGEVLS